MIDKDAEFLAEDCFAEADAIEAEMREGDIYGNGYDHGKAYMARVIQQQIHDAAASMEPPQATLLRLLALVDDVQGVESIHLT